MDKNFRDKRKNRKRIADDAQHNGLVAKSFGTILSCSCQQLLVLANNASSTVAILVIIPMLWSRMINLSRHERYGDGFPTMKLQLSLQRFRYIKLDEIWVFNKLTDRK